LAATATPVLDLFRELAAIPSPSGRERPVADRTLDFLRDLGLDPTEDDAGAQIGSDMGNIHVALPPSDDCSGSACAMALVLIVSPRNRTGRRTTTATSRPRDSETWAAWAPAVCRAAWSTRASVSPRAATRAPARAASTQDS